MPDKPRNEPDGPPERTASLKVLRAESGARRKADEHVVSERTLVLSTPGETIARLQYLPGQEVELAAGFLVTSGLASPSEADRVKFALDRTDPGVFEVKLTEELEPDKLTAFRERSSLAACGALSECDAPQTESEAEESFRIDSAVISAAMRRFRERSELFKETGAVHSAMVVDVEGGELAFAEDIGRHNALDKAVGDCVLRRIPIADKALLTSGRLTAEMVSKCVHAGVPVVVSPGAPTDRAVEIAGAGRVTLVGFARGDRMNVYTAEWRLT